MRLPHVVLALLAALALGGCSPMLHTYLEKLDPDSPVYARAIVTPPRAPTAALAAPVVACRFDDVRPDDEQWRGGPFTYQCVMGVCTFGIAPLCDAFDADDRDQLLSGVESELPRRLANHLAAAHLFESASFVDRTSAKLLDPAQRGGALGSATHLLTGALLHFGGELDATAGRPLPATRDLVGGRGAIVVQLKLLDLAAGTTLFDELVAVDVHHETDARWFRDATRCVAENRLAVMTLGAFLQQAESQLRVALAANAPAAPAPAASAPPTNAPSAVVVGKAPPLAVRDLDRAALWYRDYLGFAIAPRDAAVRRVVVELGAARLVLEPLAPDAGPPAADAAPIRFEVPSGTIAAMCQRLGEAARQRGLAPPPFAVADAAGAPLLTLADEDGHRLEFVEPKR